MRMPVSVIIPAINEGENISSVLSAIPPGVADEVIVVDGGSTDDTVARAQAGGARIVTELRRGYGRACASGVGSAQGDVLIFMDADGADDPTQTPDLLAPILAGSADMVLGSRLAGEMAPGSMLWHQEFGNRLVAWLIRQYYGLRITDLSPFRAVKREKLSELGMVDMTYGWPTEMIVKAALRDWRVVEVPVRYRPRQAGRSKISGTLRGTVLATYRILCTVFRYSIGRRRPRG